VADALLELIRSNKAHLAAQTTPDLLCVRFILPRVLSYNFRFIFFIPSEQVDESPSARQRVVDYNVKVRVKADGRASKPPTSRCR